MKKEVPFDGAVEPIDPKNFYIPNQLNQILNQICVYCKVAPTPDQKDICWLTKKECKTQFGKGCKLYIGRER